MEVWSIRLTGIYLINPHLKDETQIFFIAISDDLKKEIEIKFEITRNNIEYKCIRLRSASLEEFRHVTQRIIGSYALRDIADYLSESVYIVNEQHLARRKK